MRATIAAIILGVCSVASAQPYAPPQPQPYAPPQPQPYAPQQPQPYAPPQPQPYAPQQPQPYAPPVYGPAPRPMPAPATPPPYPQPYGPPVYGAVPGPTPVPATPPPRLPRRWTWSLGIGIGPLGYDETNGPCTTCSHSNVALGGELTGGIELGAGFAAFARFDFAVAFVDGLGTQGMGRSGKLQQVALIGGGRMRLGPHFQLLGGVGVGATQYAWEEHHPGTGGIFGDLGGYTEELELSIGSGVMALGGARLSVPATRHLDLGIEGTVRVMHMGDAGSTSLMLFNLVGGWL